MKDTGFTFSSGDVTADRRFEFARQFQARGDFEAASDLARQALEIVPHWGEGWFALGEMLAKAGHEADAGAAFTRYLTLDPGDKMGATLKLALLGQGEMPQRLPDDYVRSLFDQYAPRFDAALVDRLRYLAPELLRAAVDEVQPPSATGDVILDLGCGTGLSGEAFKSRARCIDGVDLSPAMVAEADKKGIYDKLESGEIRAYLNACSDRYDLVLAVDVLIYMGALEDVFAGVKPLLEPRGLFCFTVQKTEGAPFLLGPDHRYAYSDDYLKICAAQTGFETLMLRDCVLRQDEGRDVSGLLCLFRA